MRENFLMIFLFSFLIMFGFTSDSFSQLIATDLTNTIVELRLSPNHVEVGDSIHTVGYVNLVNKNGLLVEPKSPTLWAEKIKNLIDNPDVAKKLGKNAKEKAKEFSLARMVRETEELYRI